MCHYYTNENIMPGRSVLQHAGPALNEIIDVFFPPSVCVTFWHYISSPLSTYIITKIFLSKSQDCSNICLFLVFYWSIHLTLFLYSVLSWIFMSYTINPINSCSFVKIMLTILPLHSHVHFRISCQIFFKKMLRFVWNHIETIGQF